MLHAGRFWTTAVARSLSALRTMNREMCWRRFQYFLIAPLAHPGLFGVGRGSRWSVVGGRDAFDERGSGHAAALLVILRYAQDDEESGGVSWDS